MSTRTRKLYSRADLREAERNNEQVRNHFAHKGKRRRTVQVRVSTETHAKLKELAKSEGLILSFVLDLMCKHFFKNYV